MQPTTQPDDGTGAKVGCAGWSLPRETWPEFPPDGTHLQRYAARFNAVEINSSFYRPHQPATYARWAESVPAHFRFSAKLPKTITHEKRLRDCQGLLDTFLPQVTSLGEKLGCLLVQLPPSLAFDAASATAFLRELRLRHAGDVALEPRHASWFTPAADDVLKEAKAGRVLADPVLFDAGRELSDFTDTAALVSQLDLVITVDTSVAHLAGALGRPVWILLPHCPDWRWMVEREDSPWYPSARLYRQQAAGDWRAPFAQIRTDLARLVAERAN